MKRDLQRRHFDMLPPLETGDIPEWCADGSDTCLVIPLYRGARSDIYLRSCAYALLTWMRFSDAQEQNVPCYIYLCDDRADMQDFLINEFGVPSDLIFMPKIGDTSTAFEKVWGVFFDEQFDAFDTLVIADADLFCVAPLGHKLPFFKNLKDAPAGVGCYRKIVVDTPIEESWVKYWFQCWSDDEELLTPTAEQAEAWYEKIRGVSSAEFVARLRAVGDKLIMPLLAVRIARRSQLDIDYFRELLQVTLDDEVTMMVLEHMKGMNIWSLKDIGIKDMDVKKMYVPDYLIEIQEPYLLNYYADTTQYLVDAIHSGINHETSAGTRDI